MGQYAGPIAVRIVDRLRKHQSTRRYLSGVRDIRMQPIVERQPSGFVLKPVALHVAVYPTAAWGGVVGGEGYSQNMSRRYQVEIGVIGAAIGFPDDAFLRWVEVADELFDIVNDYETQRMWGDKETPQQYGERVGIIQQSRAEYRRDVMQIGDDAYAHFAVLVWEIQIEQPWA